jgi:hypothetical protein
VGSQRLRVSVTGDDKAYLIGGIILVVERRRR